MSLWSSGYIEYIESHLGHPGANLAQAKFLQGSMAFQDTHNTPFCAMVSKLGRETPSRIRVRSLIRKETYTFFFFEKTTMLMRSKRPLGLARRCLSSRFNKVVHKKRIIRKRRAPGGGEPQGVADPKNTSSNCFHDDVGRCMVKSCHQCTITNSDVRCRWYLCT
jgi:hypothetical protein